MSSVTTAEMKMAHFTILGAISELPAEEHKSILKLTQKLHDLLKQYPDGVGLIALTLTSIECGMDLEEKTTTDH